MRGLDNSELLHNQDVLRQHRIERDISTRLIIKASILVKLIS